MYYLPLKPYPGCEAVFLVEAPEPAMKTAVYMAEVLLVVCILIAYLIFSWVGVAGCAGLALGGWTIGRAVRRHRETGRNDHTR